MFVYISVSSKDKYRKSKGKTQTSEGNPSIVPKGLATVFMSGEPLLEISVDESEYRGSGARGGDVRHLEKTGKVCFDKEAIAALVKHALQNNLLQPEDIFSSNLQLLEAALRVERKRARPQSTQAAA
jgi:hypothetical protein